MDHAIIVKKPLVLALGLGMLVACSTSTTRVTIGTPATGQCHVRGVTPNTLLPDPGCTPGALNLKVTQANIHKTICVRGWTKTVRPPLSITAPIKIKLTASYGLARGTRSELDHLVSLELGGAPLDLRNLWPEPGPIPNPKDAVENRLNHEVCAGTISLTRAQQAIATDWTHAP